ncbi:hypothetical protein [Sphingobacterium deserti]|uniref:Uncharacterized protein n=1 Tax=Sphingobacterium deserti TaxID=1229276 RepID=A0A0B8T178_9SPHI|nr:hypothetical protein [Sphingobacterium deserti]KGE14592.1 hypothetical protein DI53_1621 [Sphingobacterium deserti]
MKARYPVNSPEVIQSLEQVEAPALELAPGVWDIAPEREEVSDIEELNQPRPQLVMFTKNQKQEGGAK